MSADQQTQRVTARLPQSLADRLDDAADGTSLSPGRLARMSIGHGLDVMAESEATAEDYARTGIHSGVTDAGEHITIRLPQPVYDRLDAVADEMDVGKSAVVRISIAYGLDDYEAGGLAALADPPAGQAAAN